MNKKRLYLTVKPLFVLQTGMGVLGYAQSGYVRQVCKAKKEWPYVEYTGSLPDGLTK